MAADDIVLVKLVEADWMFVIVMQFESMYAGLYEVNDDGNII